MKKIILITTLFLFPLVSHSTVNVIKCQDFIGKMVIQETTGDVEVTENATLTGDYVFSWDANDQNPTSGLITFIPNDDMKALLENLKMDEVLGEVDIATVKVEYIRDDIVFIDLGVRDQKRFYHYNTSTKEMTYVKSGLTPLGDRVEGVFKGKCYTKNEKE